MRTLLFEIFEDLSHLDGRVFLTLRTLVRRPGQITVDFLADRRARYLPPFRLYILVSVIFFAFGLLGDRGPTPHGATAVSPTPTQPAERKQVFDQIVAAVERDNDIGGAATRLRRGCGALPTWGQSALVAGCERAVADGGHALGEKLLHNLPKAMFVLLPAVALVLLALFGRARRYYVEHVVFTLHLQTAAYLFFVIALLATLLARRVALLQMPVDLVLWALAGYGLWYFYQSLRTVYGQPPGRTVAKLLVFSAAYGVLLAVAVVSAILLSALTA